MEAAKELGCTPWELLDQPYCWVEWALLKKEIMNDIEQEAQDRNS